MTSGAHSPPLSLGSPCIVCIRGWGGEEWCSRNFYSYQEPLEVYSASSHGQDYWTGAPRGPSLAARAQEAAGAAPRVPVRL